MEDTSAFTDTSVAATDPMMSTGSYGYTDPISSFFGGIFFIIILFLVIVFVVIMLIGKGLGIFKDSPAPPLAAKKETFKDGPPYPRCQTNGAYAMF